MNPSDFSRSDFVYPNTKFATPGLFESHADWLKSGSLRYQINVAMHKLDIAQLEEVLSHILAQEVVTESGEK